MSVVEVKFDKENNSFVDIIFNKPVGKDDTGEILGRDPATITPGKRLVAVEISKRPHVPGLVEVQHGHRLQDKA
ncbi:MAG: hypothetical protein R3B51_09710 [Thermodesulfobacteriota bacterium]